MRFDLTRPCPNCPFRTGCLKGWLGKSRAREIITSIAGKQETFTCHKTNEFDEDNGEAVSTDKSQHCAGAMILLEKIERPNQMMRWMERIGYYDMSKLDMTSPVFDSAEDFIQHHS